MALLLALTVAAVLGLVFWAVAKGGPLLRAASAAAALVAALSLGWSLGRSWESLRTYDQYVYPFARYSGHLRELVKEGRVADLTNDVVVFDRTFRRSQSSADLYDALFRVLRVGRYYQSTNSEKGVTH